MSSRLLVLLLALVLVGCAGPAAGPGETALPDGGTASAVPASASETSAPEPSEDSAGGVSDEPLFSCFSAPYPASAWDGARPATELEGHPGYAVLLESVGSEGLDGWFVLEEAHDRLVVARELTRPQDPNDEILRTHDIVAVEDVDATNVQGWMLSQASQCAPQRVLEGLGAAQVWLATEPDPTATTVELLVMEMACNSGEDADGRVRLVEQVESTEAVELLIAVEPRDGEAACPSNPATPFTVGLAKPLGDRTLLDTSTHPPRPLDVAPEGIYLGD